MKKSKGKMKAKSMPASKMKGYGNDEGYNEEEEESKKNMKKLGPAFGM